MLGALVMADRKKKRSAMLEYVDRRYYNPSREVELDEGRAILEMSASKS